MTSDTDAGVRVRAELRRYVTAYFNVSGYLTDVTVVFQILAVALASIPTVRDLLEPATKWVILALAGATPFLRSVSDDTKRTADDILRRIEISDGLGIAIRPIELEDVRESAFSGIARIARRQELDLRPYASDSPAGPRRVVENTRETAWWSARLAAELARWEFVWTFVMVLACVVALVQIASGPPAPATPTASILSRSIVEFAAAMLVFVFAEGFFRRGRELSAFARSSERVLGEADRLLERERENGPRIEQVEAMLLASKYTIARHAAPRLSSIWYRRRRDQLNAAWANVSCEETGA
jgi:hypothetical protein